VSAAKIGGLVTASAIWLDRTEARLFRFPKEKNSRERFRATHTEHHTHRPDALDQQREEKVLFELIAQKLKGEAAILIFGPGVAKYHFRNYLNEQHPLTARKVVACQAMDHPTDRQIETFAERYLWAQVPNVVG
jgi:stalled ribosome rescue protein Dom34